MDRDARQPQDPADLQAVRSFWEENPLCGFEAPHEVGTPAFFEWHDRIRTQEVEAFALHLHEFDAHRDRGVLDVGCGIGWLCRRFALGGARVVGVDLTRRGVELTRERLGLEGLACALAQASVEDLPFADDSFDFVTCSGVLHHTPKPHQAVREIARVLRPGGRAMLSVYYRSWVLSPVIWPLTRLLVRGLLGNVHGRRGLRRVDTPDDLVRRYDGDTNPLGRCFSRDEVRQLLEGLDIERMEVHYFPWRFLRVARVTPHPVHRLLDRYLGLMIYAVAKKAPA